MAPPGTGQLFLFGEDVLSTSVDTSTNTILAQIGDVVTSVVDSDNAEFWFPPGFAARPAVPTAGSRAAQVVGFRCSDRDVLVGCRDTRQQSVYGNIKDGETSVFASTGQAKAILKADGRVVLGTKDNNAVGGNDVFRSITPTEDRFFSPWGQTLHDNTGWHLRTWHGAKIDVGGLGLPAPLNAFSSTIMISADMINIDGACLSLGRDTGTTQAVVQAVPLQVIMTSLATTLTAIGVALSGLGAPVASIPATVTALGTVGTATATKTTVA